MKKNNIAILSMVALVKENILAGNYELVSWVSYWPYENQKKKVESFYSQWLGNDPDKLDIVLTDLFCNQQFLSAEVQNKEGDNECLELKFETLYVKIFGGKKGFNSPIVDIHVHDHIPNEEFDKYLTQLSARYPELVF